MMKTDREGSLGNCKTHNSANDDPTHLNYLALAHCILMGDKEWRRRGNSILAQLRDNPIDDGRTREGRDGDKAIVKGRKDAIIAIDVKTKKRKKFEGYKDAAEYTNVSTNSIWLGLKDGRTVKGKWKFEVEKENV